jgi:hypothetical protein
MSNMRTRFAVLAVFFVATILWYSTTGNIAPKSLAAYYQTNGAHPRAMHRTLHMFRQFYPAETISLHNDGGSPKLQSVAYLYGIRNYSVTVLKGSSKKEGMYFTTPQAGADYLDRVSRAAEVAPWILLLEDDVGLHRPIPIDELKYDINGRCTAPLDIGLSNYVKPGAKLCYGGSGGMIVNSSRLLSANRTVERVAELINASTRDNIASDELLSITILMNGGTIGPFNGYSEWSWFPGTVTQHYKVFY